MYSKFSRIFLDSPLNGLANISTLKLEMYKLCRQSDACCVLSDTKRGLIQNIQGGMETLSGGLFKMEFVQEPSSWLGACGREAGGYVVESLLFWVLHWGFVVSAPPGGWL